MAGEKRKNWIILSVAIFILYLFAASVPVGTEIVLKPSWLESAKDAIGAGDAAGADIPFRIGSKFGYFAADGRFSFIRTAEGRLSLAAGSWAEYSPVPAGIEVKDSSGRAQFTIKEPGYPYFADGRTFVIGPEQNSVAAIDEAGNRKWGRDFASTITCADAEAGLSAFGLLDGTIEVLNSEGERVFAFEPGGSRLAVIVGLKLSSDGRKLIILSGIDPQRFLFLERSGHTYKVVHHEYVGKGFRRPIKAAFIGDGQYVAFESEQGLSVYDIEKRRTRQLSMDGDLAAFEDRSAGDLFFCLVRKSEGLELVGIELPDEVFMRAPFTGEDAFFARRGDRLYLSGNDSLAALDLESK